MPVSTYAVPLHKRSDMEQFVRSEITARQTQVFYVVPRIYKPDEDECTEGIQNAENLYATLNTGAFSGIPCALVHGRTPRLEQERIMEQFKKNTIKVLVTTTIIEVGIDVPNATIMIIENAERFGLSQLHQLRGRVGRGFNKSYCFLLAAIQGMEPARERLDYFCSHYDGFEIAEKDLYLRGPGEVIGFRQTGGDGLKIANIIRDSALFQEILQEIKPIRGSDADLT
jgi:ATP-dependent DNA helicase RecG